MVFEGLSDDGDADADDAKDIEALEDGGVSTR